MFSGARRSDVNALQALLVVAVTSVVIGCSPDGPTSTEQSSASFDRQRSDVVIKDPWIQVSAGGAVACGLRRSGALACWGQNGGSNPGGLGVGSLDGFSAVPIAVTGPPRWRWISTGYQGSCGIAANNDGYCWRGNRWGELGGGMDPATVPFVGSPTKIAGNHRWSIIRYGEAHVCGLTTSKSVWCWGYNNRGQVGDGTLIDRNAPVQVAGGTRFVDVHVSATGSCATRRDGVELCWGQYDAIHSSPVPVTVAEAEGVDEHYASVSIDPLWSRPRAKGVLLGLEQFIRHSRNGAGDQHVPAVSHPSGRPASLDRLR